MNRQEGGQITKQQILEGLLIGGQYANKMNMLYFGIYYSGHSKIGNSNLIAEQQEKSSNEVTFKEVLDTIKESGFNKTV